MVSGKISGQAKQLEIRGIYGSPEAFWKKGLVLSDLHVNAIFVHGNTINKEMIIKAKADGLKVFAEFPTLNGKNYVENHPEAWAIDDKGEKVKAATWFMGVCPTEPGFRKHRMDQLREMLKHLELDGVWMDYVHWHAQFEDPEPILPETCFCDHCLQTFCAFSNLTLPDGSKSEQAQWILESHEKIWRDWRCQVIVGWAKEMKQILLEEKPGALLGLYHCPWNDEEFDGARRRILGLDYTLLRDVVDVFSPMVYHGRMERDPDWVGENITWFCEKISAKEDSYPKVWPIVQAHNEPKIISPEAFEKVLRNGMVSKSSGIMMFTSYAVADDEEKIQVMRRVYTE
jgi:hypothetical protein